MINKKFLLVLGLILAAAVSPAANASKLSLDTFSDQTPATISLPATKLLMASVDTSIQGGGADADALTTTVTIGGTVVAANIAEVCVDYDSAEVACATNPDPLTDIVITLTGTQLGGPLFDYRVTLNPSAAGKTIFLSVNGFTASGNGVSDLITLPQSTATRNIAGAATAPTINPTPTKANIQPTSATLGGTMTSDGSDTATCGVTWGTTSGPGPYTFSDTAATCTVDIPFTVNATSLSTGTTYYFRAYVTNSVDTVYSNEDSFTPVDAPTVTTNAATGVTTGPSGQATLGGNVSDDGGDTLLDVGVYYHTAPGAEAGIKTSMTLPVSVPGDFSGDVTGLASGVYYFKAYATNSVGETIASNELSFTIKELPTLLADPTVTDILPTSATLGGTMTSTGFDTISDCGVEWREDGGTYGGAGSGTASFGVCAVDTAFTVGTGTTLTTGTTYYFRSYAINTVGTAYSGNEGSFVPESATRTQASNITFTRVAGRSMLISWTPGDGDGSFVVLRLRDTTSAVAPTDSTAYTDWPDFDDGIATTTGTGNFVMYEGPNSSLWITGLELNTWYSIEVYDYTGTSPDADYLQASPATADKQTTDAPTHNYDYRANCGECHNHSAFGVQGTDQKAICQACHNPSGLASDKLEFGYEDPGEGPLTSTGHPTPNRNPSIDVVNCGMCHEIHMITTKNPTLSTNNVTLATQHNKSFLRANVDKYVPGATTPAYLHTDTPQRVDPHPDAPQAASNPDRVVEGGIDATESATTSEARGYCQVCHTMTNYHRSTNTAGADQCHDGVNDDSCGGAEVHCGECHEHNNNFAASGGTCATCHASGKGTRPAITTQFDLLSTHIDGSATVTPEDCEVCHDEITTHKDQIVRMLDADDGVTSYAQPTPAASTLNTGEGEAYAPACLSCHDSDGASYLPGTGDQTPASPFTGAIAPPEIDSTAWGSASHNRPVATSGSSPVTCVGDGTNGCHGSGHGSVQDFLLAPASAGSPTQSSVNFCFNCHDGTPASNVKADFSIELRTAGTFSNRHDVIPTEQASDRVITCNDCHQPHIDNSDNPVADPDGGGPLFDYTSERIGLLSSPGPGKYVGDGGAFYYNSGSNNDPTNPIGCNPANYPVTGLTGSYQYENNPPDNLLSAGETWTIPQADVDVYTSIVLWDTDRRPAEVDPGQYTVNLTTGEITMASAGTFNLSGYTQPLVAQYTYTGALPAACETVPGRTEPDYIQFCLACHDGTLPSTEIKMPSAMLTDDIAASYGTDAHGTGDTDPADPARGTLKVPWTAAPDAEPGYAALNCTTCHGAHGSENIFNLRSQITVAGVPMIIGGENGTQEDSDYFGTDTYILPFTGAGGTQENLQWGAWCTFCHKMQGHGQGTSETSSCNSGHTHGGGPVTF